MEQNATTWANATLNRSLLTVSFSLSIIGCLIILITYALFKNIRTSSRHIIICITLSDLLTVVSNWTGLSIDPRAGSNTACIIQSFFGTTAVLCSFLWTMMLAVFLYITLVKEKQNLAEKLLLPWFHLICWGIPLLINITALLTRNLGNNADASTAGWCWIKVVPTNKRAALTWMILDGKLIEITTYIVVLTLYIKVKLHLKRKIRTFSKYHGTTTYLTERTIQAAKHADKKLIFIPLVFIFLRMWGTIRFVIYIANGFKELGRNYDALNKVLLCFHAVGDNLQSFANCVLFCLLTPKVRHHIRESCAFCLRSCVRKKPHHEECSEDEVQKYVNSLNEESSLLNHEH